MQAHSDQSRLARLADAVERQEPWQLAVLASFICLLVYLPTTSWDHVQVTDPRATAIAAWSLADHGSIEADLAWPDIPWAVEGRDGRHYIWRHPGGIAWTALFYLPTPLTETPTSALEVSFGPAAASAVVATALGIGLMTFLLTMVVANRHALAAGLLLGLGTSNWTISADGAWNHGPTLLFLTLGMVLAARDRPGWSGASFAVAITVRPHVAVAPAAIGVFRWLRGRETRPLVAMASTSAVGLGLVVLFYWYFFGDPLIRSYQFESFVTGDVNLTDDSWFVNTLLWLFSPSRGLLVFAPFLTLLVPALRGAWLRAPDWVKASAVGGLLYALIQTRADVFHAGHGFFGYRGPLEVLTLTWPLLALAWEDVASRPGRWRDVVASSALASVVLFAVGAAHLTSTQSPVMRCTTERYVGSYRPLEEHIDSYVAKWVDCLGRDFDALPKDNVPPQLEQRLRDRYQSEHQ